MTVGRHLLYLASIAGIAILITTVFISEVSVIVCLLAFVAYSLIVLVGVHFPHLQMFVNTISEGRRDGDEVSLTFDDGPHPIHTRRILDLLEAADARATFFVVGHKVTAHPDVAAEIVKRGNEIGLHGYTHDRLFALRSRTRITGELLRAIETIREATGVTTHLFRPPVGVTSPRIAHVTHQLNLKVVAWSVRACDGIAHASPDKVANRVIRKLRPGVIVMMHDAAEQGDREPASLLALPKILAQMKAKSLRAVPVSLFTDRSRYMV